MKTHSSKRTALLVFSLLLIGLGLACVVWVHKEQRQYTLNRQLIEALKNNDMKQALGLVKTGADPNTRYDTTPAPTLSELVNQMLHRSPQPVDDNPTAFQMACGTDYYSPQLEKVLPLLGQQILDDPQLAVSMVASGAEVNVQDKYGISPLMYATLSENSKLVSLLLARGADVNIEDYRVGGTALYDAVRYRVDKDIVRQLVAYGADPNQSNNRRTSALDYAQRQGWSDIVVLLNKYSKRH